MLYKNVPSVSSQCKLAHPFSDISQAIRQIPISSRQRRDSTKLRLIVSRTRRVALTATMLSNLARYKSQTSCCLYSALLQQSMYSCLSRACSGRQSQLEPRCRFSHARAEQKSNRRARCIFLRLAGLAYKSLAKRRSRNYWPVEPARWGQDCELNDNISHQNSIVKLNVA
jgi:hypothetical protein